ncbi:hypothetical protein [Brevibacillus daliensis]|uniref:hypothetical protein n=1 Tax=Brevibacillus daliensis TaxID=2892995 RepID=UPI001E29BEA1|nr:hypothetical protein [Brevibacillus daliensis]
MNKLKVFLLCLVAILLLFSITACIQMYTMERALARGIFSDVLDDMKDIGYLDQELEKYYHDKMDQYGWKTINGDFFQGTWPRDANLRSHKERSELIHLTLRIQPSRISRWIHTFTKGEAEFIFSAKQPSEYFDSRW